MIVGTNYFPSVLAAQRYYFPQGYSATQVNEMISRADINIGTPPLAPGQRAFLIDSDTRWAIEEGETDA